MWRSVTQPNSGDADGRSERGKLGTLVQNVSLRIDRMTVDLDVVMEVGTCGETRAADQTEDIAAFHALACLHEDLGHVTVLGFKAVSMVDHHDISHAGVQ